MTYAEGMLEAQEIHASFAREEDAASFWTEGAPDVPVRDLTCAGGAGQLQAVRFYRGILPAPTPVILYIHGGGWVGGSIEVNEPAVRALVAQSGWSAVSISYRLAPANPYPAGLEDCRAALHWLQADAPELGIDRRRIAIAGASAGANLAAAAALAEPSGTLSGLVLFYGLFGADLDTPSYRAFGAGPVLTRARVSEIFELYDPGNRRKCDPLITPLSANSLADLPPALVIAAELDPLADDSRRFADRLSAEGVATQFAQIKGVTHGFINRGRLVPAARETLSRAARFLVSLERAS